MKTIDCPSAPLSAPSWEKIDATRVIDGTPSAAYHVLHASSSGELTCGIYECTAGKWRVSYTEDEFCTLIDGRVTMQNDDGDTQTYAAPDSFIIPSGYNGTWEAHGHVRKYFVIYEKAK
jgi:uncharacterized cupin superfamily protein